MKNPTLEQIKQTVVQTLTRKYGYCGVADSDNVALLNSGGVGEEFLITIKDNSPPDAQAKEPLRQSA